MTGAPASAPPVDGILRKVVVFFRVLALVWMAGLSIATLATDEGASTAWVVSALAVGVVVTAATLVLGRERRLLASTAWIAIDGVAAIFLSLAPGLANAEDLFFGGMPLSWLLLVVYAHSSIVLGAVAVVLLSVAQVITAGLVPKEITANQYIGRTAVFLVSAIAYGWAMYALRRIDERRVAAEAERDQERLQRRLADERAEIAAHLHDSVLQTLSLVQRDAADPAAVNNLARRQERELRSWIDTMASEYEHSFRASVRGMAADVEDLYGLKIDGVYVGDAELTPGLEALSSAAREAMVNAAKHAGVDEISLFVEVRSTDTCIVVKDRGGGFDPRQVPAGAGLSGSVGARMHRHGGTYAVKTAPGHGTEVELCLPHQGAEP